MADRLRSTSGCVRCRKRRIKCDETHPICKRCQKSSLKCIWPGESVVTSEYLKLNTTLGNTYAGLFLKPEHFDSSLSPIARWPLPSSLRPVSSGAPHFRSDEEHCKIISLASFLSNICIEPSDTLNVDFTFAVALQAEWVRDALLGFATNICPSRDEVTRKSQVQFHYTSASRAVQERLRAGLGAAELEQLLVAVLFLGMHDIYNPDNRVYPLLHFEMACWLLDALQYVQHGRPLSPAVVRFHRIALESCLYHISIQSFFHPRDARYTTLASLLSKYAARDNTIPTDIVLCSQNLRIYVYLFELTRLSKLSTPTDQQHAEATRVADHVRSLESEALECMQNMSPGDTADRRFWALTSIAAGALRILGAKVLDRTLVASDPILRPLVDTVLRRLEMTPHTRRRWSGDCCWIFCILFCAVYLDEEGQRLSLRLQEISGGLWGADLARCKRVLEMIRARRVAAIDDSDPRARVERGDTHDTMDLLVQGRMILERDQ